MVARLFKSLTEIVRWKPSKFAFHVSAAGGKLQQFQDEPFILKSKFQDVPLSKQPFGDFMWSNANKYQGKTALVSV